jgi:hypothetical protein
MSPKLFVAALILSVAQLVGAETFRATEPGYFLATGEASRALRMNTAARLRVSSDAIPQTFSQAEALFQKVCAHSVENYRYQKTLRIEREEGFTQLGFQCETHDPFIGGVKTVDFILTLDSFGVLKDLQIVESRKANDSSEDLQVIVAAGTMESGLLLRGESRLHQEKLTQAIAESLSSSSASLSGTDLIKKSKKKSFWREIASSLLSGLAGGLYDLFEGGGVEVTDMGLQPELAQSHGIKFQFRIEF